MGASTEGRFFYCDALLLPIDTETGCTAVISEDMADGTALA